MNENINGNQENIKTDKSELEEQTEIEKHQSPHVSFAQKGIGDFASPSFYYPPTRIEREKTRICLFCNRIVDNSRKICSGCIDERRPKLSTAKYILFSILVFLPGIVYKNLVENEQKEWDLKYL